ncbi:MAG: hypothetical protein ABSA94_10765 [Acidobacteriaceae bacterium]|jgi:hypothetical protein
MERRLKADDERKAGTGTKKPRSLVAKILALSLGLFFWFGDRALREFWHFSFFASLMIWAGVLGVVVIGGLIWAHLRDE